MLRTEIWMCKTPAMFADFRRRSLACGSQGSVVGGVSAFPSVTYIVKSMLNGLFDDSKRKLALTLTESGHFVSFYAAHFASSYAHYYKKSNSLISLQAARVWLCVRQKSNCLDGNHIRDIVNQLQLNAEFDRRSSGVLQQNDAQLPLRCCEELVRVGKTLRNDVAACQKLCSASVVIQWIEQQRESLRTLAAADDSDIQSPVLLDLSYRHCEASDNAPILLLDDSIQLSGSSVTLSDASGCDGARRTAATVMVSAIRAAAELALPVNMTAVMALTKLRPLLHTGAHHIGDCDGGECMLIINLRYEPQSICDLEAFGTVATVALIFNAQFPIWRHYHLVRGGSDGRLELLWCLVPQQRIASKAYQLEALHEDRNGEDLQQLMSLADYNIVPHLSWHSRRGNRPFRTEVRFQRSALQCEYADQRGNAF